MIELIIFDFLDDCGDWSDEKHCEDYETTARCDFEKGTCGWLLESDSNDLKHINAISSIQKGPTRDHTLNTNVGHFILARPTTDNLLIVSPVLRWTAGCRVRFFTFRRKGNLGNLELEIQPVEEDDKVLSSLSKIIIQLGPAFSWIKHDVALSQASDPHGTARLLVHFKPENENYIAFDDVSFTPNCFPRPIDAVNCPFNDEENPFCEWTIEQKSEDVAFSESRPDAHLMHEPLSDINGNPNGQFLILKHKSSSFISQEATLVIRSPTVYPEKDGPLALTFSYYIYGTNPGKLEVWTSADKKAVWHREGNQRPRWHQACVPIEGKDNIPLFVQLRFSIPSSEGYIAGSSLKLSQSRCNDKQVECSFSYDSSCEVLLKQSGQPNKQAGWKFGNELLNAQNAVDHTLQVAGGGVIASQATESQLKNRLITTPFKKSGTHCVRFWHSGIKENWVGFQESPSLRIHSRLNEEHVYLQSWMEKPGHWSRVTLELELTIEDQLVIESIHRKDFTSHLLLLDDLTVRRGVCEKITCNFDQHQCDWFERQQPNHLDWIRVPLDQLRDMNSKWIPEKDVTKQSEQGGVLVAYFRNVATSALASVVTSQVRVPSQGMCLSFFYWISEASSLEFTVVSVHQDKEKVLLTRTKKTQNNWIQAAVDVGRMGQDVETLTLVFKARTLQADSGEKDEFFWNSVFIDNVNLAKSTCAEINLVLQNPENTENSDSDSVRPSQPSNPVQPSDPAVVDNYEPDSREQSADPKLNPPVKPIDPQSNLPVKPIDPKPNPPVQPVTLKPEPQIHPVSPQPIVPFPIDPKPVPVPPVQEPEDEEEDNFLETIDFEKSKTNSEDQKKTKETQKKPTKGNLWIPSLVCVMAVGVVIFVVYKKYHVAAVKFNRFFNDPALPENPISFSQLDAQEMTAISF